MTPVTAVAAAATAADCETGSLLERAKRFAQPQGLLADGAHRLSGDTEDAVLLALLLELDETILPRRIELTTDTGQTVVLEVAGRRVVALHCAPVPGKTRDHFPPSDDQILALLRAALQNARQADLQSQRMGLPEPGSNPGVAIAALIAKAGLDRTQQTGPDPVPPLKQALNTRFSAWVDLDQASNPLTRGGDADLTPRLDTFVQDGLADIDLQMDHSLVDPDDPGCILLSSGGVNGLVLLYARSRYARMLALLPSDEMPEALAIWRAFHLGSGSADGF